MPKIIKNIEENIFNAAMELFFQNGYENVDMKMIAKKCGIAVGTLYNYYPNKKELYFNILKKSWSKTFSRLDYVKETNIKYENKVKEYINILYEDTEKRKGMGVDILKTDKRANEEDEKIKKFKDELILKIKDLIKNPNLKEEERISESILILIIILISAHPEEKEKNINFVINFIKSFLGNDINK